jgi:type I restriction enzyme S subunit
MAAKRRLIDLLGEHRLVFISQAVTHGVGEPHLLEHTGSPFAPNVPATWRLNDLKHVVKRIVDTAHKTAPDIEGGRYLVVRTTNVKNGRLVLEGGKYTDSAGFAEWTQRGVPQPGDILFTREAPAGEACLVPADIPLCIGQRMVWIQVDETRMLGEFGLYSLYGGAAQEFIRLLARSTTVAHLNMSDIANIPIAVPPLDEQREIVRAIQLETERVDMVVAKLLRQLDSLTEQRQTMITAAVTGETDIPGVAS